MSKTIKYSLAVSTILLTFSVTACTKVASPNNTNSSPVAVSHGVEVKDQVSFIDALRSKGIEVQIGDPVEQPFLMAKGTGLSLNGGEITKQEIQVFNYDDVDLKTDGIAAAQSDTENIDPSGDPKTTKIMWVGKPHWYKKERIIVIYVGDDQATLKILEELLGKQFAGK